MYCKLSLFLFFNKKIEEDFVTKAIYYLIAHFNYDLLKLDFN